MESKTEKVLVVESDGALRGHIAAVLSDAGHQVSTALFPHHRQEHIID
jgi:DNA-binding response OmpR family regulator